VCKNDPVSSNNVPNWSIYWPITFLTLKGQRWSVIQIKEKTSSGPNCTKFTSRQDQNVSSKCFYRQFSTLYFRGWKVKDVKLLTLFFGRSSATSNPVYYVSGLSITLLLFGSWKINGQCQGRNITKIIFSHSYAVNGLI